MRICSSHRCSWSRSSISPPRVFCGSWWCKLIFQLTTYPSGLHMLIECQTKNDFRRQKTDDCPWYIPPWKYYPWLCAIQLKIIYESSCGPYAKDAVKIQLNSKSAVLLRLEFGSQPGSAKMLVGEYSLLTMAIDVYLCGEKGFLWEPSIWKSVSGCVICVCEEVTFRW